MSDDRESYEAEDFEHDNAAQADIASPLPSSPHQDTRDDTTTTTNTTPLPLSALPRSPQSISRSQLSDTSRSTGRIPGSSKTASASALATTTSKKASALLEGASNPALVIQQLQEWNDQLTQHVAQLTADIQSMQQTNDDLRIQSTHRQRQSEEISAQVQAVSSQYTALKQQHTTTLTSIAKLEATNVDLLSEAVKEKNQRLELETRLQRCELALRRERDDNTKLRADKKEREVQHKVEEEQWKQGTEAYRATNIDLLSRIQHLDDALKLSRQAEKELNTTLQKQQTVLAQRDLIIATKEDELLTAIRRANEHADQSAAAVATIGHQEEVIGEKQQTVLELERVVREQRDTIRTQADRISSVVFQMGRIDEWKIAKEAEEREKAAAMMEMRGVVESQEKAMNAALLSKERSDGVIGILEERLGKESKRIQELRDKQADAERAMKGVVAQLREKEAAYDHLAIKYSHASNKWTQEQQLRQQEQNTAQIIDRKYSELRETADSLVLHKQRLEDDKIVREEIIADLRAQLEALKKKDESYRKIQQMLASSTSESAQSVLALLTSNNEKYVRYTNPVAKGKLKLALQGGTGQRVKAMLRRCEVDVKELLDWCIEPQRLIDGLHGLMQNVKQLRNLDAFGKRSRGGSEREDGAGGVRREEKDNDNGMGRDEYERELELLNNRNTELNAAIIGAEADKSKSLMRLVTTITGNHSAVSAAPAASSQADPKVFLTELDGSEAEAQQRSATSSSSASSVYERLGLDQLLLSEMGLTDQHIDLMAPYLSQCTTVKEVDLRGNKLSNTSAVALLSACLTPESRVGMLDLQQNLITLDGLEEMALMLLRLSRGNENSGEEKEAASEASTRGGSRIRSASLYRQDATLLPILQLRLNDRLLLVDLRYNRLQHVKTTAGGESGAGESVKQMMRRVLIRVCRVLNGVGQGGDETMDKVDLDHRNEWMTNDEVKALITRNQQRQQHDDQLRDALQTTFDTAYSPPPNRKTSGLDQRNVNTVRPVLPAAPSAASKRLTAGKAAAALPNISKGGSRGRGARDNIARSGSGGEGKTEAEEEVKVQEHESKVGAGDARVQQVESGVVDGSEGAGQDEYGDDDFTNADDATRDVVAATVE